MKIWRSKKYLVKSGDTIKEQKLSITSSIAYRLKLLAQELSILVILSVMLVFSYTIKTVSSDSDAYSWMESALIYSVFVACGTEFLWIISQSITALRNNRCKKKVPEDFFYVLESTPTESDFGSIKVTAIKKKSIRIKMEPNFINTRPDLSSFKTSKKNPNESIETSPKNQLDVLSTWKMSDKNYLK